MRIELVVLDAMGVIYSARDDVRELLIPFLRERGCTAPDEQIYAVYRECSLGRFHSAELWRALLPAASLTGPLDSAYVRGHRLSDGVIEFLRQMQSDRIAAACLSNDVLEWSVALRRLHHLEKYLAHWTISGAVGVRKPDDGIYKSLLRSAGCESRSCVLVDDQPNNLDTARRLGFQTILFAGNYEGQAVPAGYPVACSFAEVATRLRESRA